MIGLRQRMGVLRIARTLSSVVVIVLVACTTTGVKPSVPEAVAPPTLRYEPIDWSQLDGWAEDDVAQAWPAFLTGCALRVQAQWQSVCADARAVIGNDTLTIREFFESRTRALRLVLESMDKDHRMVDTGMITGYYEPVLRGSRRREGTFQTPLYGVPDDLVSVELGDLYPTLKGERIRGRLQGRRVVPFAERAQIVDGKTLSAKELVWVDSAIDAFFLQIQGSGRVQLGDGNTIRLAYADVNGHPYRAIGRYLVEKGELTVDLATGPGLRQWLSDHPDRQTEVFNSNPSVVFFREEIIVDPETGPRGSLGVPLTAGRSVAIDPRWLPLGAPLFLATTNPSGAPLRRLVLAQDTGGAIRGAIRADLFWGLGPIAGDQAGRMRQDGQLWLIWPKDMPLPSPGIR
jgi:membrane-bound lytic murein transglycosylase A